MENKLKIFLIVLMLLFMDTPLSYSQTASVKDVNLQIGVEREKKLGLLFNVDFIVSGLRGIPTYLEISLKNREGDIVAVARKSFVPIYDTSKFTGFNFFIPYIEIYNQHHPITAVLTPIISIVCKTNGDISRYKKIASKNFSPNIYLYLTECHSCINHNGICTGCNGSGRILISYGIPPAMCTLCWGRGKCGFCKGKGYDVSCWKVTEIPIVPRMENGYSNYKGNNQNNYDDGKIKCPTCHGTGRCSYCAGRGEKQYSDGTYYDCPMCHGTGRCYGRCGGRGYFY